MVRSSRSQGTSRLRWTLVAAIVTLLPGTAVLVPTTSASGQSQQAIPKAKDQAGIDRRLEKVKKTLADAKSDADQVNAALAEIDAELATLRASLAAAKDRRADAEIATRNASEGLRVTTASVRPLLDAIGGRARNTYMVGPAGRIEMLVEARNARDLAERTMYLDLAARNQNEQLGELEAAQLEVAAAKQDVIEAGHDLAEARATIESRAKRIREVRALRMEAKKELDARVAKLQEDADALEAESERIALLIRIRQDGFAGVNPDAAKGALQWPAKCGVTSGFGFRWGRRHEGLDIACPHGHPVGAAAAGTILEAGPAGAYGNLVLIDHGGGIVTAYGHNSAILVSAGEKVKAGEIIAREGSTGRSTGPHIHFEVRINGEPRDPRPFLP